MERLCVSHNKGLPEIDARLSIIVVAGEVPGWKGWRSGAFESRRGGGGGGGVFLSVVGSFLRSLAGFAFHCSPALLNAIVLCYMIITT